MRKDVVSSRAAASANVRLAPGAENWESVNTGTFGKTTYAKGDAQRALVPVRGLEDQGAVDDPKGKFEKLVQEERAKKEAMFGFELDDSDVAALRKVMRTKYCGPTGIIGNC